MIQLIKEDFQGLGQVAKHCNNEKLQIAINESILFDLKPLLCEFYYDVDNEWESPSEDFEKLIFPFRYEGCGGKQKSHQGLKKVLAYYSYARYVMINNFDDTPNGGVNKTNEWSVPKDYRDLKNVSDRYRDMAFNLWQEVENFTCLSKEIYLNASFKNCSPCGCNGKCDSKTKVKGYGFKSSNVTKI